MCDLNDAVKFINCTPRPWMYQIQFWSTGGMIFAGEHQSTRRQTSDSATSSTTNPTWNETVLKPSLHDEMPAANRLICNVASRCCDLCVSVNVDGFQVTESKAMDHRPRIKKKDTRQESAPRRTAVEYTYKGTERAVSTLLTTMSHRHEKEHG